MLTTLLLMHCSFHVTQQLSAGSHSVCRFDSGQPGSPDIFVAPVQVPLGLMGEHPIEIDQLLVCIEVLLRRKSKLLILSPTGLRVMICQLLDQLSLQPPHA